MGIEIPPNDVFDYCPLDNPLWPAGRTPYYMYLQFVGILAGYLFAPPMVIPNKQFRLIQITAEDWLYQDTQYRIDLHIDSSTINVLAFSGAQVLFYSWDNPPTLRELDNELIDPSQWVYDGYVTISDRPDMAELADAAGVDRQPIIFGELVGVYIRLANQKDHTTIYIKRSST